MQPAENATDPFTSDVTLPPPVDERLSRWRKFVVLAGPGLLVSVGYMDPGNWATDIQAGSSYGYTLLWVVVASSIAAMYLQGVAMRLGVASGLDLASLCRLRYGRQLNRFLWILAEIAIVACDLAEVLGGALAFKLLLHVSLLLGVALTALDALIVLALQGSGFRRIEAIVLALVATIGACYVGELFFVHPDMRAIGAGLLPDLRSLSESAPLYIAIGILGATVMPHNLYLHSAIVNSRGVSSVRFFRDTVLRFSLLDTILSLSVALLINAAILILAAAAFYHPGQEGIADIEDAYRLLEPVAGPLAAVLFAVALLASGQSSTFTGTMAGQIIMEGFVNLRVAAWVRRLITRALALVPAFLGVLFLGSHAIGRLLVLSQVILSLQLPFAIYPLLRFASDEKLMGSRRIGPMSRVVGWSLFVIITGANLILVAQLMFE